MNGMLAQTAALVAHAKASRVDPSAGGDAGYWRDHSTFQYVHSLSFLERRRRLFRASVETVATGVVDWLAGLRDVSPDTVNLVPAPDPGALPGHLAAAFAGPASHGIGVEGGDAWVPRWAVTHQGDPLQRIWTVAYVRAEGSAPRPSSAGLEHAREALRAALEDARAFADSESALSPWCETFHEAERQLARDDPRVPYHPDILPQKLYRTPARQLLAASVQGWVFGGMGSWNDVVFEGTARGRYDTVTRRLYAAVTDALAAAVNSGLD